MTKYKIKDLLLTHERGICKFAILNNEKTKLKIITDNEILEIRESLDLIVDTDNSGEAFAYMTTFGVFAYPIVLRGAEVNPVLEELDKVQNTNSERFESFEEFNQLSAIMLSNDMIHSRPILSAIFGIDDDSEFQNERRNNFIDEETIKKIENAVNTAESRNTYDIQRQNRESKIRRENNLYEKTYNQTLEF